MEPCLQLSKSILTSRNAKKKKEKKFPWIANNLRQLQRNSRELRINLRELQINGLFVTTRALEIRLIITATTSSQLLSLRMMYKTTYATQDNFYTPGHTPKESQLALINSQVKHTWRGLKIKSRTLWRPVDTLQSHTRQKNAITRVFYEQVAFLVFPFFFFL